MNISLLGLFIEERQIIKNLFEQKIESNELNWVPITHEELNILILQANFLNTLGIKEILGKIAHNVQILSITANNEGFILSEKLNIPCLNLKKSTPAMIEQWLSHIKYDQLSELKHATNFNKIINILHGPQQNIALSDQEKLFIIDTQNRKVLFKNKSDIHYIDLLDNSLITVEQFPITDLSLYKYPMDIMLWVWQCLLECAEINISQLPNSNSLLKLVVWPEFIQKLSSTRNDMIVLTAYLQKNTLTLDDLVKQTNIESELIYKYCHFMINFGYIRLQINSNGQLPIQPDSLSIKMPQYKKFLSHLKKFIGL